MFHNLAHEVFTESFGKPWPFPTLKKLFATLPTYKGKFNRGIISLFEQYKYDDFKVCQLLTFKLY